MLALSATADPATPSHFSVFELETESFQNKLIGRL